MSDIAMTQHYLYEGFEPAEKGEDHGLSGLSDWDRDVIASVHAYWTETNAARTNAGLPLDWDAVLMEAFSGARIQTDPNLLTDGLLRLAATAITYAESVQRQTDEFNAPEKGKK